MTLPAGGVAIQPKTSPAQNVKTKQPYVAAGFTVAGRLNPSTGLIQVAQPTFFDGAGNQLPIGVLPLVSPIDQNAESEMLGAAINSTPALAGELPLTHWTRAGKSVVVQTRGVVLA
jgi:hypothetical protein